MTWMPVIGQKKKQERWSTSSRLRHNTLFPTAVTASVSFSFRQQCFYFFIFFFLNYFRNISFDSPLLVSGVIVEVILICAIMAFSLMKLFPVFCLCYSFPFLSLAILIFLESTKWRRNSCSSSISSFTVSYFCYTKTIFLFFGKIKKLITKPVL